MWIFNVEFLKSGVWMDAQITVFWSPRCRYVGNGVVGYRKQAGEEDGYMQEEDRNNKSKQIIII